MRQTVISEHACSGQTGTADFTVSRDKSSPQGRAVEGASQSAYRNGVGAAASEDSNSGLDTDYIHYDVSSGASRVAQLMNQDPYLAASASAGEGCYEAVEETADENGEASAKEQEKESETKTSGYTEDDIEYMERLLKGMRESRSKNYGSSSKKRLTYNYRRVSGAILRSKTRMQASNALTSAKSNLANLRRKLGTGKYSDDELRIAITHADKMVRAARKKVANLKREELRKKSDRNAEQGREHKNTVIKQKHQDKGEIQQLDVKLDQELLRLKKQLKQLSEAEKNSHRRSENYELLVADMEYLKKKIGLMRQEQENQNDQSPADQLSGQTETSAVSQTTPAAQTEGETGAAAAAGAADTAPATAGAGFDASV